MGENEKVKLSLLLLLAVAILLIVYWLSRMICTPIFGLSWIKNNAQLCRSAHSKRKDESLMTQPFSPTEPSERLVSTLGQTYDAKAIQSILQPLGVKRMPQPSSYFNDDIVWSAKASLRLDLYRAPKVNDLTGRSYSPEDGWIVGFVHFLAPGSDDRIKAPYASTLPGGLAMDTTPDDAIAAYGLPAMDEMTEWPGFSGRILAWRTPEPGINIVLEFEAGERLRSCTFCLIGCIGSWRNDQPEIFAP